MIETDLKTKQKKDTNSIKHDYSDSAIWTMFMQIAMQTWNTKTIETLQKAAVVADAALAEYKERFK